MLMQTLFGELATRETGPGQKMHIVQIRAGHLMNVTSWSARIAADISLARDRRAG